MNKDKLLELSLGELTALCRNRDIRITSKTRKPAAVSQILSYHKQNGYKKLKFKENIGEWRKEELVSEGKAAVGRNLLSKSKNDIVYTIINGHSPSSKSKKQKKIKKIKNTHKKSEIKPKRTKLNQKKEIVITNCAKIEDIFVNIFTSLRDGFKPIGNIKNIKEIMELPKKYKKFPELREAAIDELEEFSDKMLPLLPLILEAKSLVHDYEEYRQKIKRSIEKQKSKNDKDVIYYIGMKKFRSVKDIEQDEIGPFCGIWTDIKKFESWKKDKNVKDYYGSNIKRIRHIKDYNDDEQKQESENDMEMEMESEHEEEEQDKDEDVLEEEEEEEDDDGSVATEQERFEEDDLIISTEEDEDEQDADSYDMVDDSNHNKKEENEENKEDDEDDEDDEETEDEDDEDDDIDMNKNNKNNTSITKKTRSRRAAKKISGKKRRRENDDVQDGNDKKRARLNDNESINHKLPPVLSG